jgi:hypothetical protein
VVEHLARAQVGCRVVRGLILELKLNVKNSTGTWILAAVVVVVLRASFNNTLQVRLICFDQADNLVFLRLGIWNYIITLKRVMVRRSIDGSLRNWLETLQKYSI